jgi:hypothetical protein
MFTKLTAVFLLLLASAASAHGNLRLVNGQWFDGSRFEPKTMYVVDNVFRTTFDGETRTIDLAGRYVIPPFGDAHNHVFADGADFDAQLARYLGAGIFYVKNPNNTVRLTSSFRPRVNRPESVDVAYSNGGITSTGGHPTQIYAEVVKQIPSWGAPTMENEAYFIADSLADVDAKWPKILLGKPDFIKIYFEGARGLSPTVAGAVVARAHASNLRVAAHVTSTADFHNAVEVGVDEIAHLPLAPIDRADALAAASKRITVVTTTLSHRPAPGVPDVAALHRANLALLKESGVDVVLGVDDNRPTVLDEMESVARLSVYTNLELLRMITGATPRAIFPGRKFARLEDGFEASLIALDGNPIETPGAPRKVSLRLKQGHVIEVAPVMPGVAEPLMPIAMQKGVDAALAEYRRLLRDEPRAWDFGEKQLNALGYALMGHGKAMESIPVLALNAERFPNSGNVWDSLAEAYLKSGNQEKAILYYRKALLINPKNSNAAQILKKLEQ